MKKLPEKKVITRMNYLVGHLNGVIRMIKDGRYCIDIIRQNQAVIAALRKVNEMILKNHLETCVTQAIKGKNEKERREKIKEILDVFKNSDGK